MTRDVSIEPGAVFLERYQILHRVSEGGYAVVFKARQLTTGQSVAIKCLHRHGHSEDEHRVALARFRREMQLCAQLHHPNIVRLIDSGSMGGMVFTVFEFVPGSTLAQVLAAEGCLDPPEAGHLMGQVLDALSCAHSLGIVHRDLKPSNIMVVETGARRNALVLDFGIGALAEMPPDMADSDGLSASTQITGPAERTGTPAYAAPEQLRGMGVSEHSDLYSWGLVFLECLTGERAVPGATVAELIHEQLCDRPIALPSMVRGHELEEILRLATDKNPAHRRLDARGLMRLLDSCDLTLLGRMDAARRSPRDGEPSSAPARLQTLPPSDQAPPPAALDAPAPARERAREHDLELERSASGRLGSRRAQTNRDVTSSREGRRVQTTHDERRQITALSYVLWVTPDGASELDIEEQADLLADAQMSCTELIEFAGGYLADVHGHRGLAFFGYPRAHDDDARRAVDTGLSLIQELLKSGVRARARAGVTVQVGVHTGLVIARGGASEVFGEAPTVASGLAELAAPGTLVVSGETRRLVQRHFDFTPGQARTMGGLATTIESFVVSRRQRAASSSDALPGTMPDLAGEPHDSALIGRDEELALLGRAWQRTRDGSGQIILVSGEVGIGKSRLAREMRSLVAAGGHPCFEVRCHEEARHSVLWPIADLIERILDRDRDKDSPLPGQPRPRSEGAGTSSTDSLVLTRMDRLELLLLRYGVDPTDTLPHLSSLLEHPDRSADTPLGPQRKEHIMHAALALLVAMAMRTPTLLVLEDLHWADPTTLEFLALLAAEAALSPLCILATARPDLVVPWRGTDTAVIQLGRLPRLGVRAIVTDVTGGTPLPEDVLEHIERRTDGVPLFVEELTRAIIESPALIHCGDRYELGGPIAALSIPATLRDSLMARLDRLESAKGVAQIAAVLGREFTHTELSIVSELPEDELELALGELCAAGLLYRKRRLRGEQFSFKHALVQETAYDTLPRRVRKELHARIARMYTHELAELAKARPELLMHHHARAESYAEAVDYAVQAGRAALRRSACAEALAFARQALDWVPHLDGDERRAAAELALISVMTSAHMASYGYDSAEFRERMQRAWELIDRAGDSPHTLVPLWGLWSYHFTRAQHDEARPYAERCADIARRTGDIGYRMTASLLLGLNGFYTGRFADARSHFEHAIGCFDPRAHNDDVLLFGYDSLAICHAYLSLTWWMLGHTDQAEQHAAAALARADELAYPVNTALVVFLTSKRHAYEGARTAVVQAAERIRVLAEDNSMTRWRTVATMLMGWATGDVKTALQALERAQYRLRQTFWRGLVAEALADSGDIDAALALVTDALTLADRTNERSHEALLHRLRGLVLMRRTPADLAGAAESLHAAIAVARAQGARMPELMAATALERLGASNAT